MEINENHADSSQSIISAINYPPDESYPVVTVDNKRPQEFLLAFISISYATSGDGKLEWNISYKPLSSEKEAAVLVM